MAERPPSLGSILPGLPDDLAVECIARVPHVFYSTLALVSCSWRGVFHSPDLLACRISSSTSKRLLCIAIRTSRGTSRWFLLDPHRGSPSSLIPLPSPPVQASGSACVTLGPLLFLLGGSDALFSRRPGRMLPIQEVEIPSRTVQIFDARFKKWKFGPPMLSSREFAAAGAVNGKILVLGGCLPSDRWAEYLDAAQSRWISIESPSERREKWMHGSVVLNGKLVAMADRGGLAFDPASELWGSVSAALDLGWRGCAAAADGIIYTYDFLGKIRGFDPAEDSWKLLQGVSGRLPVFLAGARLAECGNMLCAVWEGMNRRMKRRGDGMQVMVSAMEVEKIDGGKLRGEIVWEESFELDVPTDSVISHCCSVQV